MNLVFFLTIATTFSIILGEFGRYPFGGGNLSFTILDFCLGLTLVFLSIWQIAIKRNLLNFFRSLKYLMPFLVVALLSLMLSFKLGGFLYYLRFILYSLSLWLGFVLVNWKKDNLNIFQNLLITIGVILSVLGFIQLIFFPDIRALASFGFDPHQGRLVSTFLDPNFLGIFFNIIGGLLLVKTTKNSSKINIGMSLILITAIFLTFSRSAYLFLGLQVLVWGVTKYRKLLLVFIMLSLLVTLIIPRFRERVQGAINIDKSARERFISWDNGLTVFKQQPLLGVGFNNLRQVFIEQGLIKTYSSDGGHAGAGVDSSILFILATTGLLGLITYGYFLFKSFFGKYDKDILTAHLGIFLGLLISCQFVNGLFYPPIMFVLFIWLGMVRATYD